MEEGLNIIRCHLEGVVFLTFDVEPDAPPYQSGSIRGLREGLPWILEMLSEKGIKATFFVVGELADRYPSIIEAIVNEGHELGSHGYFHRRMDKLTREEALREIKRSIDSLSVFQPISSFRAPNLQPPRISVEDYLSLGIKVDSSVASYKDRFYDTPVKRDGLLVLPATVTSSTIRLPKGLAVRFTLGSKRKFHVLFYHPWEFTRIPRKPFHRPDIWMRTGSYARRSLEFILDEIGRKGLEFLRVSEAVNRMVCN
ncbi:MAG: polysaccharide deacetylase family protein [Desulfurococcales archaeon]|nr:polysaccharide deacetylase family protein [Desulfurococcales archaeon]